MTQAIQFAFIVLLPLVVVGAVLAGLFAVGALFDAIEDPAGLRARVEGAFRPNAKPARMTGPGHYYRPHWLGGGKTESPAP
jgi:hypothetical protein